MASTTFNGLRIGYDDLGKAASPGEPAIMCLPGWCQTRAAVMPVAQRLAQRRRVLAVDLPGHGDSQRPESDFNTDDVIAACTAVADAAGVERVVPLTIANAGWMALGLAAKAPGRVPAVINVGWPIGPAAGVMKAGLEMLQDAADWQEARDAMLGFWYRGAPAEVEAFGRAEMGSFDFDMWARAGREILKSNAQEGSPLQAMQRLSPQRPVLTVLGVVQIPEIVMMFQRAAAENPWFTFLKLDGPTYMPTWDAADALADGVESFLKRVL